MFRGLRFGIGDRLALRVDETQEALQALALHGIKLPGERYKTPDIGMTPGRAGLREQPVSILRFVDYGFNARGQRAVTGHPAPASEPFEKQVHFRPRGFGLPVVALKVVPSFQRRPEKHFWDIRSNEGQVIEGEANQRRSQYGEEWHVLQGVVEKLEKAQQIADFRAIV